MGYYVHIEDSNCMLPHKHADLAYWRMCALNKNDDMKRGGSKTEKWFSWMEKNYPETCKDAKDILVQLGFDVEEGDGGLVIYAYDNKSGQEGLFLEAMSDLVVAHTGDEKPFITWRGEDDMVWKETYGERLVKHFQGTIVFLEEGVGMWG